MTVSDLSLRCRLLFAALLLFCGTLPLRGQEEGGQAATWFLSAPDSLTPHFDARLKGLLLEQYTLRVTGRSAEPVRNLFGGESSIESLSDTRLLIRIDDRSLFELKVIRTKKRREPVIGMLYTHLESPAVSVFAFYSPASDWERIPTRSIIDLPEPRDFLLTPDLMEDVEVKNALVERGLWLYSATFAEGDEETLRLTPTTFTEEIAQKQYPGMASKLRPSLLYEWNRSVFRRIN